MPRLIDPEDYARTMLRYAQEATRLAQNRERATWTTTGYLSWLWPI